MISKLLSEAMNLLLWRFVMNKKEFLDILYEQLSGQMPEGNVAAHVQYYRNYIEEEQHKGRSEGDILNELGDPHLIAQLPSGSDDMVRQTGCHTDCSCCDHPFVHSLKCLNSNYDRRRCDPVCISSA